MEKGGEEMETGRDAGPKVSNTTPSCHTISLRTNHHLGYHSRGFL